MTAAEHGQHELAYTVTVVTHKAEEGGYWAEVLELPGCMSQGETEEETSRNIEQACIGIIRSYIEDGEEVPLEHTTTVKSLRVPIPAR